MLYISSCLFFNMFFVLNLSYFYNIAWEMNYGKGKHLINWYRAIIGLLFFAHSSAGLYKSDSLLMHEFLLSNISFITPFTHLLFLIVIISEPKSLTKQGPL